MRTRWLLVLLLTLQASLLIRDMAGKGPAADEPRHIATGSWYLATGACCLGVADTPASLPSALVLGGANPHLPEQPPAPHQLGVEILRGSPNPTAALLRARLVQLPLALAMTLAVFALARRLGTDEAALVIATLVAIDPNLRGHGHLVSPDFLLAALLPIAALAAVAWHESASWLRSGALALALAATFLTKYTALVPVVVLIGLLTTSLLRGAPERRLQRALRLGFAISGAAVLVLLAYRVPWQDFFWPVGLKLTRRLVAGGYPSFLLGEYGLGWPHYFLVAIAVKTPVATLAGAAIGVLAMVRRRLLARPAIIALTVPALALLAAASFSRYGIGIRHVLPVLPALALVATPAIPRDASRRLLLLLALVALLPALSPRGIAYENGIARVTGGLDRILSDSNVDWGEDVPALADWRRQNPDGHLAVAVLSPLPLVDYGLEDVIELPGVTSPGAAGVVPIDQVRWLAISILNLQGTLFPDHDRYAIFRELEPVVELGGSIRVYDLDATPDGRAAIAALQSRR